MFFLGFLREGIGLPLNGVRSCKSSAIRSILSDPSVWVVLTVSSIRFIFEVQGSVKVIRGGSIKIPRSLPLQRETSKCNKTRECFAKLAVTISDSTPDMIAGRSIEA